jgi:hypothetical protein
MDTNTINPNTALVFYEVSNGIVSDIVGVSPRRFLAVPENGTAEERYAAEMANWQEFCRIANTAGADGGPILGGDPDTFTWTPVEQVSRPVIVATRTVWRSTPEQRENSARKPENRTGPAGGDLVTIEVPEDEKFRPYSPVGARTFREIVENECPEKLRGLVIRKGNEHLRCNPGLPVREAYEQVLDRLGR